MILAISTLLIKNTKENCKEVEVVKKGRKWLTLSDGTRINKETMVSEDGFFKLFNTLEDAINSNIDIPL